MGKCKKTPQCDITSHLSEWLSSKRQQVTSVGKDVEKRETSCTVDGNVNLYSHYGKQMEISQKIETRATMQSSNFYSAYLSEENKNTN